MSITAPAHLLMKYSSTRGVITRSLARMNCDSENLERAAEYKARFKQLYWNTLLKIAWEYTGGAFPEIGVMAEFRNRRVISQRSEVEANLHRCAEYINAHLAGVQARALDPNENYGIFRPSMVGIQSLPDQPIKHECDIPGSPYRPRCRQSSIHRPQSRDNPSDVSSTPSSRHAQGAHPGQGEQITPSRRRKKRPVIPDTDDDNSEEDNGGFQALHGYGRRKICRRRNVSEEDSKASRGHTLADPCGSSKLDAVVIVIPRSD
ncbi:hypothetical protein Plec18170_009340 [Paecilomyces lecythidis]